MAYKILFITASPGHVYGGGKKVFQSLIAGLNRDLFQPVVTCAPDGLYAESLKAIGIPLRPLDMANRYNLLNIFRLARIMRQEKPHIVHSQGGGRSNFFAVLAARLAKVPIRLATAATLVERWEDTPLLRRAAYVAVDRLVEKLIDRFICVSDEVRLVLHREHGLSEQQAVTVHNGIDISAQQSTRHRLEILASLGVPEGRTIISLLGRLVWVKGIDSFLIAAASLSKRFSNCHFLVVGDGPLRSALENQARMLGLADRCTFTGFQKDIPAVLKITDVLAMPSHIEGLPMVILEAMAAAIPVVGSDIGGIPELIISGKTGFLMPPADPEALAAKLSILMADENLQETMGLAAKKRVTESFSDTKMILETEQVYLNILHEKGYETWLGKNSPY